MAIRTRTSMAQHAIQHSKCKHGYMGVTIWTQCRKDTVGDLWNSEQEDWWSYREIRGFLNESRITNSEIIHECMQDWSHIKSRIPSEYKEVLRKRERYKIGSYMVDEEDEQTYKILIRQRMQRINIDSNKSQWGSLTQQTQ